MTVLPVGVKGAARNGGVNESHEMCRAVEEEILSMDLDMWSVPVPLVKVELITEKTWASVTRVKENLVILETGIGVLRMLGKSGMFRGGCRFVTDEKWVLSEVMLK